ncbi:MAG TPA: hypothetical protein VFK58_05420 [Sphingomicrobium sp.]|nr:hypothetical protein [Sphingomicrobium sp.]
MVMLAPIATLVFLTVLWVAIRLVADLLADSGARISAALRGEERATALAVVTMRRPIRGRYTRRQPLRARPKLRAAA